MIHVTFPYRRLEHIVVGHFNKICVFVFMSPPHSAFHAHCICSKHKQYEVVVVLFRFIYFMFDSSD